MHGLTLYGSEVTLLKSEIWYVMLGIDFLAAGQPITSNVRYES